MISLRLFLILWAVAGPILSGIVVWGAARAREAIVVSGAVRIARGEEVVRCNAQRASLAATLTAATRRAVAEAQAAATTVPATPAVPAELAALCKASASCRDRGKP